MDGLLIIDKPAGCTSHDVVDAVRRITGERRAGHGGTLDPDATGLLTVGLGKATRFFPYISGLNKTYIGTMRLGLATDTYDASGEPITEEITELPPFAAIKAAIASFTGDIIQTPPPYSAKKINGRPAHRLARAGGHPVLAPVPVRVDRFALPAWRPPLLDFEVDCSSGTYIRSLAHDLGLALGCGAHLVSLRRTAVGPFSIDQAVTPENLLGAADDGSLTGLLIPLERLLPGVPAVFLTAEGESKAGHGMALGAACLDAAKGVDPSAAGLEDNAVLALFGRSGKLVALGRFSSEKQSISPFLVVV